MPPPLALNPTSMQTLLTAERAKTKTRDEQEESRTTEYSKENYWFARETSSRTPAAGSTNQLERRAAPPPNGACNARGLSVLSGIPVYGMSRSISIYYIHRSIWRISECLKTCPAQQGGRATSSSRKPSASSQRTNQVQ